MSSKFFKKKSNRIICVSLSILLVSAGVLFILFRGGVFDTETESSITLVSPSPVTASFRDEIVIDAVLSDFPERIFPAASISVSFDKNKLEFVGVKQGTMMTLGDSTGEEKVYNIPIWNSDPVVSNQNGKINSMYLDITGGKYAYIKEGFSKGDKDVLLRLAFKLRDSAQSGENYNITINDAVLAAADNAVNKTSLATDNNTLKAYHAKVVVK